MKSREELNSLINAYKVITKIMKENNLKMDTSFKRVQSWLSNEICDNLNESYIKDLT